MSLELRNNPKPVDYKMIDKAITKAYSTMETNNSTICDIMSVYIKGQKILYTEAKTLCEIRLNYLMLPAIFLTMACSILSVVLKDLTYGTTITSGLNGVNTFILAVISYMKLDARAEAHRTTAYKFDKLQSYLEFNSGKILFVEDASKDLGKVIAETESSVNEIKQTNQFILPEKIRYAFPKLCGINVFSEVKKIQTREIRLINEIKDIFNEIKELRHANAATDVIDIKEEIKRAKIDQVIRMKDDYLQIDRAFEEEMSLYRKNAARGFQLCWCLKV